MRIVLGHGTGRAPGQMLHEEIWIVRRLQEIDANVFTRISLVSQNRWRMGWMKSALARQGSATIAVGLDLRPEKVPHSSVKGAIRPFVGRRIHLPFHRVPAGQGQLANETGKVLIHHPDLATHDSIHSNPGATRENGVART
jgi:hypothetical protein